MIITLSWKGAGLMVICLLPLVLAAMLLCSVNLIGKDFTKAHFKNIVLCGTAVSGVLCYGIGRWLNRVDYLLIKNNQPTPTGKVMTDDHQLCGIPFQHWCWVYFGLTILLGLLWKTN